MKEHKKLGRSFQDLLSENQLEFEDKESVQELDILMIRPNPDQPRTTFDDDSLNELAQSIKEHGIIQPIIVKPSGQDYILVAGERRLRAAKLIGLQTIPAIIREYNAIYLAELAILENLQREDLSAIEEALALQKLQYSLGITHEVLGQKIGKSRVYVTNSLGLLTLPQQVLDGVNQGVISAGHARALSKIKDHKLVVQLYSEIIENEYSVRELEDRIRAIHTKMISPISKQQVKRAQHQMNDLFKNKFKVKVSTKSISFNFKDEQELDEIVKFLENYRR